jgi:hypothetical protein
MHSPENLGLRHPKNRDQAPKACLVWRLPAPGFGLGLGPFSGKKTILKALYTANLQTNVNLTSDSPQTNVRP